MLHMRLYIIAFPFLTIASFNALIVATPTEFMDNEIK